MDWISGSDLAALRDSGGTAASPSPLGKRFNDGDGHSAIPRSHRDLLNISDEEEDDEPEVSLSDSYVSAMHDMVSTPSVQRGWYSPHFPRGSLTDPNLSPQPVMALTAVPKLIHLSSILVFAFSLSSFPIFLICLYNQRYLVASA